MLLSNPFVLRESVKNYLFAHSDYYSQKMRAQIYSF
ncbi:hypothetical protein PSE_0156 [Pseudovibrio sp. FO-BEG1]|nr:hypothetical protein PSE_0156 [Pseudovibrio sp. FO-BEG1]